MTAAAPRRGSHNDELLDARTKNPTWGAVNRDRLAAVRTWTTGDVVDIGCGSDVYLADRRSAGHRTVAVDLLDLEPTPTNFVRGSVDQLPFADRSFGTALLFEVLEHVPDPDGALREIGRVSDRLIMSVPNCELSPVMAATGLVPYHFTDRTHVNFFDRTTLAETLERTGWAVRSIDDFGRASPGALALHGWGLPTRLVRAVSPVLKRLPLPRPPTMSLLAVADRRGA